MRYIIIISILLIIFTTSCSKQKFSSTPSLKFESVNTTSLHQYDVLRFTFSFTDAQGDFSDTTNMFVQKIVPNCVNSSNIQFYPLPAFPPSKDQKGTITFTLGYNAGNYRDVGSPQCQENDTAVFRFVLRDNANHASDTANSPKIVIYY